MSSSLPKILISGCLFGHKVRYDGSSVRPSDPRLDAWEAEGRLIPCCPEVAAGASAPRPPSEIRGEGGGDAVLDGMARVVEPDGKDVTALFVEGAQIAVETARAHGCAYALLQPRSPSCGSKMIYDGTFGGGKIAGRGVAAAALRRAGVEIFDSIDDLVAVLSRQS